MSANSSTKPATGRPPGATGIRAQAARHAAGCLSVLASIANSERAAEADRIRAAEVVLSHAVRTPMATTAPDDAA